MGTCQQNGNGRSQLSYKNTNQENSGEKCKDGEDIKFCHAVEI